MANFLQLTPENIAQAKNMSWGQAISQDFNPRNPNYRGFSTAYQGADKTGLGKYVTGGLKSLAGIFEPGSNVGGATPLTRKLALGIMENAPKLLSRAALPLELLRATPANADEVEWEKQLMASIPTRDEMIKAGITKKMIEEGTATPMGRTYGNMSMGQGRPDWVADRSPVSQGLKEIEIGMAPFVANRIPGQQDLASDFFMDSITKNSKFYDPYKPTFRDRIKQGLNKYAKPVMSGIMSAFSGIPGMGLLMNAFQKDPYAQNRIDMYGAYRDPNTGFMKDKFGYNVGKTLFKNRFMEPGSNSYRSYALDAMRGMKNKSALDNYYQSTYGKTWDQVKKDHQKKQDPFNNTNPFARTADNFAGGADKSFDTGQPSTAGVKGSSYSRGNYGGRGHHWAKGGIVSLWRR